MRSLADFLFERQFETSDIIDQTGEDNGLGDRVPVRVPAQDQQDPADELD